MWLRWVASVGTCGAQSAASMSFVDVLPFDPAMPITFPPHARRTWRAIAPSAVSGSSASSTQTPVERPRAAAAAEHGDRAGRAHGVEEVVAVGALALERAEQRARARRRASR